MIVSALVLTAFSAVLAAALGNFSNVPGFLKYWALCALGVVGLTLLGTFLGLVMRSALCASVWYAECG